MLHAKNYQTWGFLIVEPVKKKIESKIPKRTHFKVQ